MDMVIVPDRYELFFNTLKELAEEGATPMERIPDVLFGDHRPTGKLSFSWPRSADQHPINVGDEDYDGHSSKVGRSSIRLGHDSDIRQW